MVQLPRPPCGLPEAGEYQEQLAADDELYRAVGLLDSVGAARES